MISLTADELSIPLSMPNSIRDIALRFFLNTFVLHYGSTKRLHSCMFCMFCVFRTLLFSACSDVYEACIHINAVSAQVCPSIFFTRAHKDSSILFVVVRSA